MTFGIYCICQNEERFIRQCIEYSLTLKPDQFVIVDGGSTDNTLKIIKEYPQIDLYENPMGLDFSIQRNFALSKMKTDWMLAIDADELYSGLYPLRIQNMIEVGSEVIGYSFPTEHLMNHHIDADPHVRLFRNLPELKYKQETCEWLFYTDEQLPAHPCHMKLVKGQFKVEYIPDIYLIHFAYLKDPNIRRVKAKNYMKFNQSYGHSVPDKNFFLDKMDVIYVLEGTGMSGGIKVVFEHVNKLKQRGWNVRLFALEGQPYWFPLEVQVETFGSYEALTKELLNVDAIKIATWWKTAAPVVAGLGNNIGFYLIQDIETSYTQYKTEAQEVLLTYNLPLIHLCEAIWVKTELLKFGKIIEYISIGCDNTIFKPVEKERVKDRVLYLYRPFYLKNEHFFKESLYFMNGNNPKVITVGVDIPKDLNCSHLGFVSNSALADLYSTSRMYVMSSSHEGFGLPALEAMSCGCPVICTKAQGNEEFCIDNETALMCDTPQEMGEKITALLKNDHLWNKLSKNGIEMSKTYSWDKTIDKLERVLKLYA